MCLKNLHWEKIILKNPTSSEGKKQIKKKTSLEYIIKIKSVLFLLLFCQKYYINEVAVVIMVTILLCKIISLIIWRCKLGMGM
jgi:hypothetical protein